MNTLQVDNEGQPYLTDLEFRALLTLHMIDDPTGLSQEEDEAIEGLLRHESYVRGYILPSYNGGGDWVKAYHEFKVDKEPQRKDTLIRLISEARRQIEFNTYSPFRSETQRVAWKESLEAWEKELATYDEVQS